MGPVPYFHESSTPPSDCWVNSGIFFDCLLTELEDPYIYFTGATYIPFANMKRISFDYAILGQGIQKIYVNDTKSGERFPVTFPAPTTKIKLLVCSQYRGRTVQYPFIQVRRALMGW